MSLLEEATLPRSDLKGMKKARCQWLTPGILATGEAKIGRIIV
jgi:hypothetical protein